jgi:hypothetical protein
MDEPYVGVYVNLHPLRRHFWEESCSNSRRKTERSIFATNAYAVRATEIVPTH